MTKACVLCGADGPRVLYRLPALQVLECAACRLAYVDETLSFHELAALYRGEDYYSRNFSFYVPGIERRVIEDNLQDFRPVEHRWAGGRILDLGCADGGFLAALDASRWDRYGVDISAEAIQRARARADGGGIDFRAGELAEIGFPAEFFDVVTLWMLVEHLRDPRAVLAEVHRILRPDGLVILKTPNRDSLLAHLSHWLYRLSLGWIRRPLTLYYTLLHLCFFDPDTLGALLRRSGFEVVNAWQDERYVTKHAMSRFAPWQRAVLRAFVACSRWTGKLDALVMVGEKRVKGLA